MSARDVFPRDAVLTVPASGLPVSYAEVKAFLRLTADTEQALIENWIALAAEEVLRATDYQMLAATWMAYFDGFPEPDASMILTPAPLSSVVRVEYRDSLDQWVEVTSATYLAVARGPYYGSVILATGRSWPSIVRTERAVRVTYVAGHATAAEIPPAAKEAVKHLVAHWYMHRMPYTDRRLVEVPATLDVLYSRIMCRVP